jgi:hypothetical protein
VQIHDELARLAGEAGFDLRSQYCDAEEMRLAIREIGELDDGAVLSDSQRLGLLENFRAVLLTTATTGNRASIFQQSRLRRWRFLAQASPAAARAYAAVLIWYQIAVPVWLREVADE